MYPKFLEILFSKEHKAALQRVWELERMLETEEDKRIARMDAAANSIVNDIKHSVSLYLINGLFEDYVTEIEVKEMVNDVLRKDFRRRMDDRHQNQLTLPFRG